MRKLGTKQLTLQLDSPLTQVPASLAGYALAVAKDGNELIYTYEGDGGRTDIIALLKALDDAGIRFKDLHTTQSSLEDIFVSLLRGDQ
jgi:ABC-2 type transport system ATP-binding protein